MRYVLALDQGTTSSRAMIVDSTGAVRSIAQKEFRQIFPRPGWVEHDPEEIWTSQIDVAREAIERARLAPSEIAAIGVTNQRETTIVWDRQTGEAVYPAIVWQDRRTAAFCEQLKRAGQEPIIQQKTGLLIDAYFSASKLRWILDAVPGARDRARDGRLAFGTVDTWLLWKLTAGAVHATDASNASRTMLFNIGTLQWDADLLDLFDVPASLLPEVRGSSEVLGRVSESIGLGSMPVAGLAGDQQAALFGQLCGPGLSKNTYGTGCFLLQNIGPSPAMSRHRLLTTIAWRIGARVEYALEGSVFVGGALVQWIRDGLGLIRSAADIEPLALSVPDSGGLYLVPAFAGLGAPHWDPYARGAMLGITRGTTAAHIARAALEAVAFQVCDLLDAVSADSLVQPSELRVDGGAAANNLLLQMQTDLLGLPVVRPLVTETTALGAAYLAGLAVGVWQSPDELNAQRRVDRRFEPQIAREVARARRERWTAAVERAKRWETGA